MGIDMTDLEMVKRCAEKMGIDYQDQGDIITVNNCRAFIYDPLTNDAQALALLVFLMSSGHRAVIENNAMNCATYGKSPILSVTGMPIYDISTAEKMRRAIVECVARLPD